MSTDDVLMRLKKRGGGGVHLKEVVSFEKKVVHLWQEQYVPSLTH